MAKNSQSEQFSLRWNNFSSNLTSGFLSHLTENDLVDVTLAVEGQLLRAHKLVLSVCSPYFKNIFKENPCQHPVVILKDTRYAEVESLLRFMYQGEINIKQEDLPTFLKVAQTLQVKGLAAEETEGDKFQDCDSQFSVHSDAQSVRSHSGSISKTGKQAEMIDRRKRSRDITKSNAKKKKRDASLSESVRTVSSKESDDNDKQEILLLSNEDSDDSSDREEVGNVSHVKEEDEEQKDRSSGSSNSLNLGDSLTQSVVEPVTYRLSARGRPQLVHEGYVYNLTSRSEGLNRSHYRCAEQHRGCRGKCAVIAERFMPTGVLDHNHPPGYQSERDYRKKKGMDTDSSSA